MFLGTVSYLLLWRLYVGAICQTLTAPKPSIACMEIESAGEEYNQQQGLIRDCYKVIRTLDEDQIKVKTGLLSDIRNRELGPFITFKRVEPNIIFHNFPLVQLYGACGVRISLTNAKGEEYPKVAFSTIGLSWMRYLYLWESIPVVMKQLVKQCFEKERIATGMGYGFAHVNEGNWSVYYHVQFYVQS